MTFVHAGAGGSRQRYEAHGQPVQGVDEGGGVVVIRDITARR
jgi:hypothetical protein